MHSPAFSNCMFTPDFKPVFGLHAHIFIRFFSSRRPVTVLSRYLFYYFYSRH